MPRKRTTPPTASSVRRLANKRGYLLTKERRPPHLFKLVSLLGRATPIVSKDTKHRYSWKLADADAWLRKQPLLSDR